jgi:hypothetical protein
MRHEKGAPWKGPNPEIVSRAGRHREPTTDDRQLDLLATFDADEGKRRRDDGQRAAVHGEDVRIVAALETEVRRLAARRVEFIPDDIMPELTSRKALGPVFARLAKAGEIVCVGTTTSTRPERHGALTRVWRGVRDG